MSLRENEMLIFPDKKTPFHDENQHRFTHWVLATFAPLFKEANPA
jgi:hypothetical protein